LADTRSTAEIDLRAWVFIDDLQPGLASFLGSVVMGFYPRPHQVSLFVEVTPGIAINVLTDIALKNSSVEPGIQYTERYNGLLEIHHDRAAEVLKAGKAILAELGMTEADRWPPQILASQLIEDIDSHQAQPVNRMARGDELIPGETLLIIEVQPAANALVAANEAEKAATLRVLDVEGAGSMGRIYLSGRPDEMRTAEAVARASLEVLESRPRD
jgi:ethanolamine utilization microcompartment shell protein EutS